MPGGRLTGADEATAQYSRTVAEATLRPRAVVAALFTGFELVDPGVVYVNQLRNDDPDHQSRHLAQLVAVGRKPATTT